MDYRWITAKSYFYLGSIAEEGWILIVGFYRFGIEMNGVRPIMLFEGLVAFLL